VVSALVVCVYVEDLAVSTAFYADLLGLVTTFESDWIVQLTSEANQELNLSLQLRSHDLVPEHFQQKPQGVSIAFVVPDTDVVFEKAKSMQLAIVQEPRDEEYGQRRFLTTDPDGLLIDVSSLCEPSAAFVQKYMS